MYISIYIYTYIFLLVTKCARRRVMQGDAVKFRDSLIKSHSWTKVGHFRYLEFMSGEL